MARKRAGRSRSRLEVWKFGGASVADAAAVRHAVALVQAHRGPLVVVVSALAGVTDALLDGSRRAVAGDPAAATAVAATFRRAPSRAGGGAACRAGRRASSCWPSADAQAREYEEIAHAMAALGGPVARGRATLLVARGERAASAAGRRGAPRRRPAGRARRRGGVRRRPTAATAPPRADLAATRRQRAGAAAAAAAPSASRPWSPGFIGAGPDGTVTTLGRGGSDLTATLLARSLGAARVVLWKDVAGILTADPRAVPDARLLPAAPPPRGRRGRLLRRQGAAPARADPARRLAGSRSTCARSCTRSARAPRSRRAGRSPSYPVKALATIRGQALVTVAGKGMMGVPGIAARTFAARARRRRSRSRPSSRPPPRARSASRCRESKPRRAVARAAGARSATSCTPASSTA